MDNTNFKKIIIFFFLFFILIISKSYSQINFKPFEEFIGKWEGIYEIEGNKNKETLENNFIHKNMYLEMSVSGQMVGSSSYKYTSSLIFTMNDKEEIIGWGFDEDGYDGFVEYKGKIDGDKVVLKGKNKNYTVEVSYEIKNDKLVRKSKWIFKDTPNKPSVVECIYKKI